MLPATKDDDWKLWCRLCASKNTENSVNAFINEQQTGDGKPSNQFQRVTTDVTAAIEKYFSIKIKYAEQLPKVICTECFSKIEMLVSFSERIAKVQHMFQVLLNCNTKIRLDKAVLRIKYDLDEENESNDDDAPTQKRLKLDMDNVVQIKKTSIDLKDEEIEIEEFLASSEIEAEMLDIEKDLTNLATDNNHIAEEPTNSSLQKDGSLDAANLQAGKIKKRSYGVDGKSRPHVIQKLFAEWRRNAVKHSELKRTFAEKQSFSNEHVVRGIFHESSELTTQMILTHVETQNNNISTKSWRVLNRTVDGNTVRLDCVIDSPTMSQFISSNLEIYYRSGKTKFVKFSK